MSEKTRQEVLAKKRGRYGRAGKEHKTKIIDEMVELFGYHRKGAIRALKARPEMVAGYVRGGPREYDPEKLRGPLKAIWLGAMQPCGVRLKACLPDWLPAYEEDHRRLNADVRQGLMEASRATLDRLLIPVRIEHRRRATTRIRSPRRPRVRRCRTRTAPTSDLPLTGSTGVNTFPDWTGWWFTG